MVRYLAAVLVLLAALPAGRALVWRPLPLEGDAPRDSLVRSSGVVHVHTTLSDGSGSPEDVAAAGREAGLDFLVLTDHGNAAAVSSPGGYDDGLLVLGGVEVSTHQGHLLGIGLPPPALPFAVDARNALDDLRHLGGAAFAAHPTSPRDDFTWSGWDLPGPWGVEVLNMDSLWRRASWPTLLGGLIAYPPNPAYALASVLRRPDATLARWDALLLRRDAPGLAGADAHGSLIGWGGLLPDLPSYGSLFAVLRTWLLLDAPLAGDYQADALAVRDALARGRSYMAVEALAPAGGFFFHAVQAGETWQMGDTLSPAPVPLLRAGGRLPRGARITLYRDGERIAEGAGLLEHAADAQGAWRVEVSAPDWSIPWIFSNPIYVYGSDEAAARARRAAWPEAPPAPALAQALDAFEPGSALIAESRAGTWVDPDPRTVSQRAPGAAAARLHFRFDEPRPEPAAVWGALVDRTRRDLSAADGLVFDIRADGEYRIWVALWEQRPDPQDDEPDWWLSSVRTSTAWQRQAIAFERLYPASTAVDDELDLRRIVGLLFYVDRATAGHAAEGRVWLERLGTY